MSIRIRFEAMVTWKLRIVWDTVFIMKMKKEEGKLVYRPGK